MAATTRRDLQLRRYTGLDDMKADEYRYWAGRPAHERLAAAAQLSRQAYAIKEENVQGLRRSLVHLKR